MDQSVAHLLFLNAESFWVVTDSVAVSAHSEPPLPPAYLDPRQYQNRRDNSTLNKPTATQVASGAMLCVAVQGCCVIDFSYSTYWEKITAVTGTKIDLQATGFTTLTT